MNLFMSFALVVETKAGKIRGATEKASINKKTVLKYLNIPYAEAPVGELRFEKPVPKKPWRGNKFLNLKFPLLHLYAQPYMFSFLYSPLIIIPSL